MAVELTLIGKAAGRRKTRLTEEVRICWSRCEHGCARRALALQRFKATLSERLGPSMDEPLAGKENKARRVIGNHYYY
ncbi:MAG: hypothetical protein DMG27_23625 [Acidobacteria bacterium]|nr:MAG: hypothetical protein DMG27_23625 [Acidobacteriota bacterium]